MKVRVTDQNERKGYLKGYYAGKTTAYKAAQERLERVVDSWAALNGGLQAELDQVGIVMRHRFLSGLLVGAMLVWAAYWIGRGF